MSFDDQYLARVAEAIEFIQALGSIVGLLGIIFGLLFLIFFRSNRHNPAIPILIVSFMLVAICGLQTGTKYFGLYR